MKIASHAILALACAASLQAQEPSPTLQLGISLGLPMGDFSQKHHNPMFGEVEGNASAGIGFLGKLSYPMGRHFSLRLGAGWQSFDKNGDDSGSSSDDKPGYSILSANAHLMFFPNNSFFFEGLYLFGGASYDFETEKGFVRKGNSTAFESDGTNRPAMEFGLGYAVSYRGDGKGRFFLEGTYHSTLGGGEDTPDSYVPANYLQVSIGWAMSF